jgi:hypothetical protein
VLTEISTVTGANNLIVLGLRRWFGVVDSSCWLVDVHCGWFQFSSDKRFSELNWSHLQWTSTNQQLESTTPNHRRRPSTIKLLAPVTLDISVSTGLDGLALWIQAAGLLMFTVNGFSLARKSPCWLKYRQLLVPIIVYNIRSASCFCDPKVGCVCPKLERSFHLVAGRHMQIN